jgi:opacity protein-like surface antigen
MPYSAPVSSSWQQPSSSYSAGYQSSSISAPVATSAVAATAAVAAAEPKQGLFSRLFGGLGRKEETPVLPSVPPPTNPVSTGYGSYGLGEHWVPVSGRNA